MRKYSLISVVGICLSVVSNAQTPADDPGIGGQGTGSFAPLQDGNPVVPFDGGMSLLLVASGIGYASKKLKRK